MFFSKSNIKTFADWRHATWTFVMFVAQYKRGINRNERLLLKAACGDEDQSSPQMLNKMNYFSHLWKMIHSGHQSMSYWNHSEDLSVDLCVEAPVLQ